MKITIKTKNLNLTENFKGSIEKKLNTAKKFVNILKKDSDMGKTLAEVFVEVERETKHHRKGEIFLVRVEAIFPGKKIIAQKRDNDLIKAISGMVDEFKNEIKKYKLKTIEVPRRQQRKTKKTLLTTGL
jgi:ribosomal subunit interface protein